jgi:hypothetical protein
VITNHDQFSPGVDEWYATMPANGPTAFKNTNITPVTFGGTLAMDPGQFLAAPGTPDDIVARWTAPATGLYQIEALFEGMQYIVGATTDVHVLDNSTSIFDGYVNGWVGRAYITTPAFGPSPEQSFSTTLAVSAGDTIDFVVGNGGNGQAYDGTGVSATIRSVPEPSSLALIGLGIAGSLGYVGARKKARRRSSC